MVRPHPIALFCVIVLGLVSGCSTPNYVNKGEGETGWFGFNEVSFQVHDAFTRAPPDCIAILPLTVNPTSAPHASAEDAAKVRLSLFAHLATQSRRDIKLERVDHELAEAKNDRKALGERLKCDAVIEGQITEYGDSFYGIYSRVAVGLELKVIRTADGVILWEGSHVAASHGGTIPLDPVGVAMSIADAANNIRDEQILRVTDDVTRRLVSTIPDGKVLALGDPGAEPFRATVMTEHHDDLALAAKLLADGNTSGALVAVNRILDADPNQAKAWFVKGRILMISQDYATAEPAIVKAVALDRGNVTYLNALGVVNAQKGATDRALAAYGMAIAADSADGFAWYNSAVIFYNNGNLTEAADGFYAAGLAYVKAADYSKAERSLTDLRELAHVDPQISQQIKTLQEAITAKTRRTS